MQNAPKWNEKLATESEADIKAEREPETVLEELKDKTAKWFKSHKDNDKNDKSSR
ncbi:uncharacterized protein BX663DRAFT_495714 [Cokeromyces recurvatus]|uniref:uncharacterized protein n=1 Tax=Cokeromyces recurvatus TaxID=90255 RepID=UPI00221FBE41|nr:uncharacterized protein BX663DRAFT_495714 [Cokeromyces recurvatus]KAI7907378.1 hypothetical protein BX663DRAFT_495714 [Cokeromyces recurvatus]